MKILSTAAFAMAALVAAPAFAAGPAWTYGQLGYTQYTSGDDTSDSFNLDGSLGIADLFHVQAQYSNGTFGCSDECSDVDFDGYKIVAGVHPHVGPNTDAVLNVRYSKLNLDDTDNDTDGWGLGAGLRHMLTDKFEVNAMISWDSMDVDHTDYDYTISSWSVGGRYLMTPALSVGVTYSDGDTASSYNFFGGGSATVDLRYQFGDIL